MRRPNRAWCGIVLGLAVVIGCGKKPKTDPAPAQPEPAPAPAPISSGKPASDGLAKAPSTGGLWGGGSAQPAPNPNPNPSPTPAPVTVASNPSPEPAAPVAGAVELITCRFDKVENALTAAKGKVVLVDCWARWCPPCIASFPKLVEKHEKYAAKGLVCVSISIDEGQKRFNTAQVHAFLKEKNATFQNFYITNVQGDSPVMDKRLGEINGIPHAALFNKQGVKVWNGHPMDPKLVALIEKELAK